jgi:hypothetical protein
MQVHYFASSFTLKIDMTYSTETCVDLKRTTRPDIPEDSFLRNHRCLRLNCKALNTYRIKQSRLLSNILEHSGWETLILFTASGEDWDSLLQTHPVSETLCSFVFLVYRHWMKAKKPSFECYKPSSERFIIYQSKPCLKKLYIIYIIII